MIPADDVAQHGDLRARWNQRLEIEGCFWSAALGWVRTVSDFRGVDTDEPHSLPGTSDHHVDGVTVNHMVHNASTCCNLNRGRAR